MTVSYVKMGSSDLTVSRIIPGLMRLVDWKLSKEDLRRWIHACYEMGITTFDHADIYGGYRCEALFGEALAGTSGLRDKLQLITKCGIALPVMKRPQYTTEHYVIDNEHRVELTASAPVYTVHHYTTTREHIIASAERSLKNLHTDWLDVLLIHRPDPLMNADEVAAALIELKEKGKVLHFGVSNFLPFQFDLLQSRLNFPLVTNQIEFSITHIQPLDDGTLDQAQRLRQPPMVWSPLGGGGLLTGSDERHTRIRAALQTVADEVGGVGIDQIALAWIMMHPAKPLPVMGTGRLERIKAALDAEMIELTRQQWFAILEASTGHEVP